MAVARRRSGDPRPIGFSRFNRVHRVRGSRSIIVGDTFETIVEFVEPAKKSTKEIQTRLWLPMD